MEDYSKTKPCGITTASSHDYTQMPKELLGYQNSITGLYLCSKHQENYDFCKECFKNNSSILFYFKDDMFIDNGDNKCRAEFLKTNSLQRLTTKLNDPAINKTPMVCIKDLANYAKLTDLSDKLTNYALQSDVNQYKATVNTLSETVATLKKTVDALSVLRGLKTT